MVNTNAAATDPGNAATTGTNSYETDGLQAGVTYYAHIKTIDNAGNTSSVYTVPFTIDASGLTVEAIDPSGAANDGKTRLTIAESVGQGNKLMYWNAGSGAVNAPGYGETLSQQSGYRDLPATGLADANDGDNIGVVEVDADGKVIRFGQTTAKSVAAAAELAVVSVDPAGVENNGKTQLAAAVAGGNKLVYRNFGSGDAEEPGQDQTVVGFSDFPEDGRIAANPGDMIGVAEVDENGKVVRYGAVIAKVLDESAAKGLVATVADPTGAGTDGKTKVAVHAEQGNKLVYMNFKKGSVSIPATGSGLDGLGYEELSTSGLVESEDGDVLGIAEIDPDNKVVRYTTVPAAVAPEAAAKGLSVIAKDAEGADGEGKTQIAGSVGEGNKLVYMNFGKSPVAAPLTGEPVGPGYMDLPESGAIAAGNGDYLGVAEIDGFGNVVKFGTTRAVVTPESAAKGLAIAATDAKGEGTDGKTKIVSKAAEGNKLVYVNFGEGPAHVPGVGDKLSGYAELRENGLVEAKPGELIGVAEVDEFGKVVKYGIAEAVVVPEAAAKTLAVASVDPTGEGSNGKTLLKLAAGTAIGTGNKLVYLNGGANGIGVPKSGSTLTGYAELPADGRIEAAEGDNIAIAEVNASGKVVRFGIAKAEVASEAAAQGLSVSATDPTGAGTEGKTRLESANEIGQGNKLVYLNFGRGSVLRPETGDILKGYTDLPQDGLIDANNGDRIGVAEIDASGKVVKFGLAEAAVYSDTAADGLQVSSVDPAGSVNDGKTVIQANAATGNKLVYVNFGNGTVLTPNTGELLTGYADLPANGIVLAVNGDRIAVAELDAVGRVVRFGVTNAVVVDSANEGAGYAGIPVMGNKQGVEVLVNGKIEYAGTATLTSENGRSLTTIDVDQAKLQAQLDKEGHGAIVTIPWSAESDIVVGQLTGRMVKNMEERGATLVLNVPTGSYSIPTDQIRMASLAERFGGSVELDDIHLQIRIARTDPDAAREAASASGRYGVALMADPVTFTVHAVYNGQSIEITDYGVYVERTVALPEEVDPDKITTGVVFEADGTLRHVPTKVTRANERYYAQINSLTNSDYGVIWNPMTFDDLTGHWSAGAVNDMGSRLVVNGVGGGRFNPDADITRAEFAAIVARGLGLRVDKGDVPFTDVAGSEWYAGVVNTAFRFGLIAGYEDGSFRPHNKITRQEAMTIMARAMKITGLKEQLVGAGRQSLASFRDADGLADWAMEGAILSVAAGVMNGRTPDLLKPAAFMTRAEVATIVQRLLRQSDLI